MTNHLEITDSLSGTVQYLTLLPLGSNEFAIAVGDPSGLINFVYNSFVINYTDATKATISSIVYKQDGVTVGTLTYTSGATTDTWTRS